MPKYVVVRGDAATIATDAGTAGGTIDAGISPLTALNGDEVNIVEFTAGEEDAALTFSINRPDWFATVYDTLAEAEKNATARVEGH